MALRSRGYPTVDVPLGLLTARVSVQRPALILCDADAPGVLNVVENISMSQGTTPAVIFLGSPDGQLATAPDAVQRHAGAVFQRPVEVYALLRKVEALIGAPPEGPSNGPLAQPSRTPVLVAAARKPYMVDASHHEHESPPARTSNPPPPLATPPIPIGQDWDAADLVLPAQLSLLPEEPAAPSHDIPHSHVSPELAALLQEAERRLEAQPLRDVQRQRLSPEAEVDAVLPPDVLASLDEPLDDDDDFEQDVGPGTKSGSEGGGTAPGSQGGSSALHEADDPQSRATNPGGAVSAFDDEPRHDLLAELPPTDPPPTPTRAPPTPSPRSLSYQAATAAIETPADSAETGRPPARDSVHFATPSASPRAVAHPPDVPPLPDPGPVPTSRPPRLRPASHRPPPDSDPGAPSATDGGPQTAGRLGFPRQLTRGAAVSCLAEVVQNRLSGALVFEDSSGIRRVVFREGDFVTASTSAEVESLVAFLEQRGDLSAQVAGQLSKRLPPFGRHAGAALIANGHLKQDELWSVLRAHAEWLISRLVQLEAGQLDWEGEVPDRLRSEPAVFGGSTGAEVLVEMVKRVTSPEQALVRLGGSSIPLNHGPNYALLGECALSGTELDLVRRAPQLTLDEAMRAGAAADFPVVCLALVELGVLSRTENPRPVVARVSPGEDPLDDRALRARVTARFALVEEGDYFEVLGVSRMATDYEIKKAHDTLKQDLNPARVLTARNADLRDKLDTILLVLDEAYEILGDAVRRERYRRAIEAQPN